MVKIQVIKEINFERELCKNEVGNYFSENIYLKIGKNKHYLCRVTRSQEWCEQTGKIKKFIYYNEKLNTILKRLENTIKNYTGKEVIELKKLQYAIRAGKEYYKRGSKNYEGIKITHK